MLSGPVVEIAHASVAPGGRPVLRGIDLTVQAGERLAIVGANGSGKSTLIRSITGLWPLTSGSIRLFGTELKSFREWSRIGYVPQRAGATSGVPASVREVVASGRLTRLRPMRRMRRADRLAIDDALELVGLADRARDGIGTLSGGQQQRALIARALAGEPEVFILDEPTAGVDLPNQLALAETLTRLADAGATLILVAHELGPLAPLIQRTVVMRDGRIRYDGPRLLEAEVHALHDHAVCHPAPHAPDHLPQVAAPVGRTIPGGER